jgi:hypothetical protein
MFARLGPDQVALERDDRRAGGPIYALASRDGDRVAILVAHWSQGFRGHRVGSARWQCLLDSGSTREQLLAMSTEIHRRGAESVWEPFWRGETAVEALGVSPEEARRLLAARDLLRRRAEEASRPIRVRLAVAPLPFDGPVHLTESIVDARRSNAHARKEPIRARLAEIRHARVEEVVSVVRARGLDADLARTALEQVLTKPSAARALVGSLPGDLRDLLVAESRGSRERIWTLVAEQINREDGIRLHAEARPVPREGAGATLEVTVDPDSVHLFVLEPDRDG